MRASLLESLLDHPRLGRQIVHRQRVEGRAAVWGEPARPLARELVEALEACGIERLYAHQAHGLDLVRAGHDVLVATPTASGKTLLFALAVLESLGERPRGRALLLYPTKALAQDQLAGFRALASGLGGIRPPRFEIYDGDTPPDLRRRIRSDPPEVLITNPDMLHLGILAHHAEWDRFFRDLRFVVLDELHVYRGLFGAHVHHILRRLERVCRARGVSPRWIAASATIGNPEEFARRLLDRDVRVVAESGAPAAAKDVLFVNPIGVSPYTTAVRLLIECIGAGKQTIAFTKARRVTELLYQWLVQAEPALADRVAPYRAGYLPEERRRIEGRLFRGELAAVLSTSALELGIDVGGLDACILVGYPGSLVSSWQRIGRVGRKEREGLVVLVALPDALDQYLVRHPERFFDGVFERATLDPWNPLVAGKHLPCAAAESPLERAEISAAGDAAQRVVDSLVRDGRLVEDADGTKLYALRRRPHREVRVRSAGEPFAIVEAASNRSLGEIDGTRVHHECHPGAVYLHGGRSYVIDELDLERRLVVARRAKVDYFTVVLGDKETEILERHAARRVGPFAVAIGRLRVTVRVREYQKRRLFDGEPITSHPLDVPPRVFETIGLWIEIPPDLPAAFTERRLHFMGGIHAAEHATIGLFPLLAIADRDDLGGISYTGHPQTGTPAIFVYDGVPGGAGLAEQAFAGLERLLALTADLVERCPCEDGCPGCIQSPKCGNGNRPLDKAAAILVLQLATGRSSLDALGVRMHDRPLDAPLPRYRPPRPRDDESVRRHGVRRAGNLEPEEARRAALGRTVILDVETQRGVDEVGGWGRIERLGLALAVVYDETGQEYRVYREGDVDRLLVDLALADRVVGFNIDRFDLRVLAPYCTFDLSRIATVDMLWEIHSRIGFRLSLDHLARTNLGESKTASGIESLAWWREGRADLVEEYCRKDVELTRRLWQLGRSQGFLLYRDHAERTVRVPVSW
jgi:DEAD/DEAH box helicase domain-containing protein